MDQGRTNNRPETDDYSRLIGLALAVIAGGALLIAGALALYIFASFDTQYAPGYSDKAFRAIKPGDSEASVIAALGPPFFSTTTTPYESWLYSARPEPGFSSDGRADGTQSTIQFTNDHVSAVSGWVKVSRNTWRSGSGLNYLRLSDVDVENLKGLCMSEVIQRFGNPQGKYEYPVHRVLTYSRSPSSSNYRLKTIGLDGDGRVIQINDSIYWD